MLQYAVYRDKWLLIMFNYSYSGEFLRVQFQHHHSEVRKSIAEAEQGGHNETQAEHR
jgi:hypothetical protein